MSECTCGAEDANWLFHELDCPVRERLSYLEEDYPEGYEEDDDWLLEEDC